MHHNELPMQFLRFLYYVMWGREPALAVNYGDMFGWWEVGYIDFIQLSYHVHLLDYIKQDTQWAENLEGYRRKVA